MIRKLYTTSDYIDEFFNCIHWNTIILFRNKKAAEYDAQWLVDAYKKSGKKVKKPVVYRVRFEKVRTSVARRTRL